MLPKDRPCAKRTLTCTKGLGVEIFILAGVALVLVLIGIAVYKLVRAVCADDDDDRDEADGKYV